MNSAKTCALQPRRAAKRLFGGPRSRDFLSPYAQGPCLRRVQVNFKSVRPRNRDIPGGAKTFCKNRVTRIRHAQPQIKRSLVRQPNCFSFCTKSQRFMGDLLQNSFKLRGKFQSELVRLRCKWRSKGLTFRLPRRAHFRAFPFRFYCAFCVLSAQQPSRGLFFLIGILTLVPPGTWVPRYPGYLGTTTTSFKGPKQTSACARDRYRDTGNLVSEVPS